MEFFFNELSVHSQFKNLGDFRSSTEEILRCHSLVNKSGYKLYCSGNLYSIMVYGDVTFQKAVNDIADKNFTRSVLSWIHKTGPFWENESYKDKDDTFRLINNSSNTDITAASLSEAAIRAFYGSRCYSLSYEPSDYTKTPLSVLIQNRNTTKEIHNFWKFAELGIFLKESDKNKVSSWDTLIEWAKRNCTYLHFADYVIDKLTPEPYSQQLAARVQVLLEILNELNMCECDKTGSAELQQRKQDIKNNYFSKKKALFTDESDTNKRNHKKDLTFEHPEDKSKELFCPFHGKIKMDRQFRIHFNWPKKTSGEKLYIVYIGPKITKD
ncbi:MAG: hypothetical protein H7844_01240 [Nitrospirae bacterium YQR-1]